VLLDRQNFENPAFLGLCPKSNSSTTHQEELYHTHRV
jgi:hypothetical protein